MKRMKHLTSVVIVLVLLIASFVVTSFSGASPRAYAACPPVAGYLTFGFDVGRTSYNPSECVISPSVAPPFNWVGPFALPVAPREGIATDTVRGYVAMGSTMVAFLLTTGVPIWGFPAAGPITGAATVSLGNIYFGDQTGVVYALNPGGGLICSVALGAPITTTPIVLQNIVIVSAGNGRVYGIDANTCAGLWVSPLLGRLSSPTLYSSFALVSAQVTSTQSSVYALNALTGAVVGSSAPVTGLFTPPAVMLRQIYVGTDNPAASVINFILAPPALPINWVATTGGDPVYGKPAVDNNTVVVTPFQVYAVSATGKLFAFNATTGALNWAAGSACGPLYKAASPTVANNGVYVGGVSCINAFKTLGGATWSMGVGTLVDSPATVVNGMLLFTANVGSAERVFSF